MAKEFTPFEPKFVAWGWTERPPSTDPELVKGNGYYRYYTPSGRAQRVVAYGRDETSRQRQLVVHMERAKKRSATARKGYKTRPDVVPEDDAYTVLDLRRWEGGYWTTSTLEVQYKDYKGEVKHLYLEGGADELDGYRLALKELRRLKARSDKRRGRV